MTIVTRGHGDSGGASDYASIGTERTIRTVPTNIHNQ